jgi:hypothetical protein
VARVPVTQASVSKGTGAAAQPARCRAVVCGETVGWKALRAPCGTGRTERCRRRRPVERGADVLMQNGAHMTIQTRAGCARSCAARQV